MREPLRDTEAKTIIQLPFAQLEIYDDYVISTINEGVVFDTPHLEKLHEVFVLYFPNRPFGYIANRVNDYTVNPICYVKAKLLEQMAGMAVWCHTERNYQTAVFTKPFFPRAYEPFFKLEECVLWIEKQLESDR
ncbi:MAG: hypothetical protein R3359_05355 [Marinirhabdus sp.]|nr:hypothetical protein [Marinirhabdus sp.]